MKIIFLKITVFIATFIAAVFIFSSIINHSADEMTMEMEEATLPTVALDYRGIELNLMHGVTGGLRPGFVRGAILPLSEDRALNIIIHTYGNAIQGISYEVRSADGTRLVENTEITDFTEKGDDIGATLHIKDLIQPKREYSLTIILKTEEGKEIRYFSRFLQNSTMHAEELLKYTLNFSRDTFDKTRAKRLVTYLESNSSGDNSSYAHVNIHSSFDQITWGNLGFEPPEKVYPQILELDESTASFRLRYALSRAGSGGEVWYDIEEYYRVRYTKNRIYLLSYEREMREVFNPELSDSFANDKIMLGITDANVNILENEDGKVVVFEQNGALYAYRNTDSRAVRIFSFFDDWDRDERNIFDEHGIRILNADENGNVHFIVYGYMNRGRHEGDIGAAVYYYDGTLNQIEEEVYIPCKVSYDYLKCEIEKLAFYGKGPELYLYLDEKILKISLEDRSFEILAENIPFDALIVSESGARAGWQTEDGLRLRLIDFKGGGMRELQKGFKTSVIPLGFVGEDLIYGLEKDEWIPESSLGIHFDTMSGIYIEDTDGKVVKTYERPGIYITGVTIEGGDVILRRIQVTEGRGFESIDDDQIVNNEPLTDKKNLLKTVVTEEFEKIVEIDLAKHISTASVHVVEPEEVIFEGSRDLDLVEGSVENSEEFIVCAKGRINKICRSAFEAVGKADELSGVVLDSMQRYIWQKGNRAIKSEIADIEVVEATAERRRIAAVLDAVLYHEGVPKTAESLLSDGMNAMEVLEHSIEGAKALNLNGCPLNSVLYYVSIGNPVIAETDIDNYVLIIGYDSQNTVLMDPVEGRIYRKGINDSRALFAAHGNSFVSYIKER